MSKKVLFQMGNPRSISLIHRPDCVESWCMFPGALEPYTVRVPITDDMPRAKAWQEAFDQMAFAIYDRGMDIPSTIITVQKDT